MASFRKETSRRRWPSYATTAAIVSSACISSAFYSGAVSFIIPGTKNEGAQSLGANARMLDAAPSSIMRSGPPEVVAEEIDTVDGETIDTAESAWKSVLFGCVLGACLAFLTNVRPVFADGGSGWDYDENGTDWKLSYSLCDGKEQSPINIDNSTLITGSGASLNPYLGYTQVTGQELFNNGKRNVQVNGDFGIFSLPDGTYNVKQFHFHFPSEHTIDGKPLAGEMHIVHQREGAEGTEGLAVVGILLQEDDGSTPPEPVKGQKAGKVEKTAIAAPAVFKPGKAAATLALPVNNAAAPAPAPAADGAPAAPALTPEMEFMKQLNFTEELPGEHMAYRIQGVLDIPKAFATELAGDFYHYSGSLTTPPCSEKVHWYVLKKPALISPAIAKVVQARFGPNNRVPEPLNARSLVFDELVVPDEFNKDDLSDAFTELYPADILDIG